MTEQPASSFAGLLRQLRAEAGLTQDELAQAAGLGLRTVSDLERGAHRTAHQDTARLLADGLGLPEPVRGLFMAAARGRAEAAQVLAARRDASAALAAMVTSDREERTVPVPRELPADVGAFTGRAVELAELDLLLPTGSDGPQGQAAGPVVISAVSGTAGVGKTALAVRWAHRAAAAFPDGQLYVNLRGYDPGQPLPPGETLARFLRALGAADQDMPLEVEERAARFRSIVAGKRLLVVLDNAATEEQVRPLLPGSASVMVVVTSRDSLAGLVARDGARRLDLDLLPMGEAVTLLRALVGWRAEADPEAAEELTRLCVRLPLALRVAAELAIARPDTPLAELTAELTGEGNRLQLLAAGGDPRAAVASVFSWSYRHLPLGAARMFRLLSLHPGTDWDRYAAAALTATTLAQAGQLLDVLARAHLIQPTGPHRYGVHDLLRAYAVSQATSDDTDHTRREALTRLFDYYLATCTIGTDRLAPQERRRPNPLPVSTPVPELRDRAAAREWLDTELANFVSMAAYTAEHGWPSHTTRLAIILVWYFSGGHDTEALAITGHAVNAARLCGDVAAQAETLYNLGYFHYRHGDYQQAEDCYRQSLTLARDISDRYLEARALGGLGSVRYDQARSREAVRFFRQASALARENGDQVGEGTFQGNLAQLYIRQGRYRQAARIEQRYLALWRDSGDLRSMVYALSRLGEIDYRLGQYEQAADRLRQALAAAREVGDRWMGGNVLARLGDLCNRQGRHDQAAEYHQQALVICRETGNHLGEALTLNGAGETLLAAGEMTQAHAAFTAALALARQAGIPRAQARALVGLGQVSHRQGQHAQAAEYHQQALALYRRIGDRGGEADALNGTGETLLAIGEPGQALTCYTAALALTRRTGDRYQRARAHRGLATTCHATGQRSEAEQHWQHARRIYTDLGVSESDLMRTDSAAVARAAPRVD